MTSKLATSSNSRAGLEESVSLDALSAVDVRILDMALSLYGIKSVQVFSTLTLCRATVKTCLQHRR